MTIKITPAVTMALTIIAIAPSARAEIASRAYVDQGLSGKMNTMTVDSTPTSESANLVSSGGVAAAIASAVSNVDLSSKQDKLGGGNDAGKVVVAGSTAGTVSYTGIDTTPTESSTNLITSGALYNLGQMIATGATDVETGDTYSIGVENEKSLMINTVANKLQTANGALLTDASGNVVVQTGAYLDNSKIKSDAAIEMGKIALPTPPSACEDAGCMLMYAKGKYTWEVITRDTNETVTIVAANAVNATTTTTSTASYPARGIDIDCAPGQEKQIDGDGVAYCIHVY